MLSTYRGVLAVPGAATFSGTGLLARLPISMLGLGIVLLVSAGTGSYALAGALSATFVLANAAVAVPHGRLLDRVGQSRVLVVAVTVSSLALVGLMTSVELGWPRWTAYACAAVSGAALPQVGSCVRARWSHVLDRPAQVQTAFALEAVLDEVVFVVGPVLVTVLATTVHPLAGLGVALVTGLAGTLLLAGQRATEPRPHPRRHADGSRAPMAWLPVALLTVVMVALGTLFGSAEVVTVAFAESLEATRWAGAPLALFAAGSLLAGVVTGAVAWRRGPDVRLQVASVLLAVLLLPTPFLPSLGWMGAALFVAGFAVSPALIAATSLVEAVSPRARLTEAMAVLHTGLAAGVALGAAAAGPVVDGFGASAGYWVAVAGAALAAASAQGTAVVVHRGGRPLA